MISINNNASSYLSWMRPQPAAASSTPNDALTPLARNVSDALQTQLDAYQKHWAEANRAVEQLSSTAQDIAKMRKAAAAERLERVKEQIRLLIKMGGIGDPKAMAQQIAQLAKELTAVVKEYIAAGGTETAQALTPTTAISNANDALSSNTPSTTQTALVPALSNTSATANAAIQSSAPAAANSSSAEFARQYQNIISAGLQKNASNDEADLKFLAKAQELAKQLESLAKLQEVRLLNSGVKPAGKEVDNALQAVSELEKTISKIAASITPVSSLSIFA